MDQGTRMHGVNSSILVLSEAENIGLKAGCGCVFNLPVQTDWLGEAIQVRVEASQKEYTDLRAIRAPEESKP